MEGQERKVEFKCAFTVCGVKFFPEASFKIPPEMWENKLWAKNGSAENILIPVRQILCRQVETEKQKYFFISQKALVSKAISGLTEAK